MGDWCPPTNCFERLKEMADNIKTEEFIFTDNGSSDKAVLGTLEGPCADFVDSTRNGRHYTDELWEKVFADGTIASELIENGGIPGEMDHPADREETDSSRIAILMKDKPEKKDGKLWAKFQILNTPLGKIAYTLAKAGFNLGISSRGSGDTYTDFDGEEYVDEDTYDFKAFDLVLVPAVKDARLHLVTESLNNKFDYKKALTESLKDATEKEKKVMMEELDRLGIKLTEEKSSQEGVDIDATVESDKADNDGNSLVEELQAALLQNQKLQEKIGSLQEKLSVCYAKEYDYKEEIDKRKETISRLIEANKALGPLKKRVESLTEELDSKNKTLADSDSKVKGQNERLRSFKKETNLLKENLSNSKNLVENLKNQMESEREEASKQLSKYEEKIESLNEEVISLKKDSTINNKRYQDKLEKANSLVEKYKKIAKASVERYIDFQATKLGVPSNQIKSRLGESYTFDDIDAICEDIQDYRIGLNNLPFRPGFTPGKKMKVTESIDTTVPLNEDDKVDDTLLSIVGLK